MADKASELIAEAAQTVAARWVERFDNLAERCESPIERLFLAGLLQSVEFGGLQNVSFFCGGYDFGADRKHPFDSVDIFMQAAVGPYRVDFLIDDEQEPGTRNIIIVECDGHAYHERTKEQARRDKARDRYFASLGVKVLRFTGSELFADCEKCADEVFDHLTFQKFGPFGENSGTLR